MTHSEDTYLNRWHRLDALERKARAAWFDKQTAHYMRRLMCISNEKHKLGRDWFDAVYSPKQESK